MSWYLCCVFFFVEIYINCEKWVFSFDRSNMQIFTLNITRVVWPHVTSLLDLRYFCRHNPSLYHLKLIPGHYWSWQRIISSLMNNFVRHTFSMSKSGIKTETVLTMTDTTEPTELLAFERRLIADGFAFSFGQHKSVKRALAFGVSAYWSRNTVYSSLHRGAHIWFSYIHNHYSILIGWRILIGQTSLNGSTGQYPQLLHRLNCRNCTIYL